MRQAASPTRRRKRQNRITNNQKKRGRKDNLQKSDLLGDDTTTRGWTVNTERKETKIKGLGYRDDDKDDNIGCSI